jgi:hypothetical protein
MVESQIGNLIPSPSFGHNLCFKCPNGSCEPILDSTIPRNFQWYKEIFNPMGFDPWNCFLKIQESIKNMAPKMGAHLGVSQFIPSHSPTLLGAWDVTPRLSAHTFPSPWLVVSPMLGLWHKLLYYLFIYSFNFCNISLDYFCKFSTKPYFVNSLWRQRMIETCL